MNAAGNYVLHTHTIQADPITSYHGDTLYLVLSSKRSSTEHPPDCQRLNFETKEKAPTEEPS